MTLGIVPTSPEPGCGCIEAAVMERTGLGTVVPLDAGWSDVGSWSALWDSADRDEAGNVLRGRVISNGARNCYLRSEHRLRVEDLVVVETDDAVLVAHRDRAQEVKAHRRIYRPRVSNDGVVKGTAVVENDGVEDLVRENQNTNIPRAV